MTTDELALTTLKRTESELSVKFSPSTLITVRLYWPTTKAGMETTVLSVLTLNTTFPLSSKTVTLRQVKFSTSKVTSNSLPKTTSSIG